MRKKTPIPARTIERMVLYKRLLSDLKSKGVRTLFSHELAELANNTSTQVRRDLMEIGQSGSPRKGYDVVQLIDNISRKPRRKTSQDSRSTAKPIPHRHF